MERTKVLVWDLPVRLFHWLLAGSFTGAFITAESERYRDAHVALGYIVLGLIAFRLVWAVVGTRYARISSFAFGPRAVVSYCRSLLARNPEHHIGHNPAGSWAIYALVALSLLTGISGYAVYTDSGVHWIESMHEGVANTMLAVVVVHVIGVVVSSVLHRENLIASMFTGYKAGAPADGIESSRWVAAVALAAGIAILWNTVDPAPATATNAAATDRHQVPAAHHRAGRDND